MNNKELLAKITDILRPYTSMMLISMAAMVVVGGFNGLQAYMVKPLLDENFYQHNARMLNLLPLGLLLVFFVKGVFYFLYSFLLEKDGQFVLIDSGDIEHRAALTKLLRQYGVKEFVRTGTVGILRGSKNVSGGK